MKDLWHEATVTVRTSLKQLHMSFTLFCYVQGTSTPFPVTIGQSLTNKMALRRRNKMILFISMLIN